MNDEPRAGSSRLILGILLLMLLGIPMVAYLWETLNRLLAGIVETDRLLIAVPVAVALIALLRLVSQRVRRWEADRRDPITDNDGSP